MTQTMSDEEISAVLADDQADEHDVDPDAPYGRNPRTNKPYTMPPEQRAEMGQRLADARRNAAAGGGSRKARSPRKRATAAGTPRAPERPDYITGAKALLQLPAFALALLGRFRPAYMLDSATITINADAMAIAIGQAATEQQWLADVLDKALAIGPAGTALAILLPVGMQMAANHGYIKPNPEMGILTPEQLMAELGAKA